MFQIHDTIFYPSGGICVIDDIRVVPFDGMPDRNYYIIHPTERPQETFFVPVDSDKIRLRRLIDRAKAEWLMAHLAEIAPIEESNIKLLKERIAESLACCECVEWARVLRTVERHREIRAGRSRRISDTERAWADTARRCLAAELAAVLERPQAEVEEQIDRCIEAER